MTPEKRPASIAVSEEVDASLREGRAVVALESTIISHGLPWPRNLDVALELEEMLRSSGVTPATIGLPAGRPTVGLDAAQLELLAHGAEVAKASIRELAIIAASGRHGATTVAATAFLAQRCGIRVFATGGIGGVHRDFKTSFDESADLTALARLPVTLVCAGVKSILDVPATLERLETLGVAVAGYRTTRMPGFYVADAGIDLDWSLWEPGEVVAIMASADSFGIESAFVLANPVPRDQELDPGLHGDLVTKALAAARAAGVQGKAVTPFLLDHIEKASGGASLEANISAVRNNVVVAAAVAVAWAAFASGQHAAGA
ncbi:MAG: pseudouridine-5'-phosphate glycosidase [Acidimicrobiales bacterium]